MDLSNLKNFSKNKSKRVGRGESSGVGKTCGRGTKGQKSRSGHKKLPAFFEGGQMPLVQRLPKQRGFKKYKQTYYEIVNIESLNIFENSTKIDKNQLFKKKLIKKPRSLVKILGRGKLSKKLDISVDAFSSSAALQIEKAGGTISQIEKAKKVKKETKKPQKPKN